MEKKLSWVLAATLVCGASVFTACSSDNDDNAERPETPVVKAIINETSFPDANFRRFLLEQDYGKDGTLTDVEIANIRVLNVAEKDIGSLKGIEYLAALDTLNCSGNLLEVLDLSKNVALKSVDCGFNNLTALDVSNNLALEILACGFNHIASLNVVQNAMLRDIVCGYNDLTSLDVSKNTALTVLRCHSNKLNSLDVSRNTALESLQCSDNNLAVLDVSKNTALTDLSCEHNELTSLVVSKDSPLNTLFCYRNKISGKNMDDLISSLPQNTSTATYRISVIDTSEGDEGNVLTPSQTAAVKAKRWTPLYWEVSEERWKEIE